MSSELLNLILQEIVEADAISIFKYTLDNLMGNRAGKS